MSNQEKPPTPLVKAILCCGKPLVLACDGRCDKAWGICSRPRRSLSLDDIDDYELFADHELGIAPIDPGVYEGGDAKPTDYSDPERQNKWCFRECERQVSVEIGHLILPDFSARRRNKPLKEAS